MKHTAARSLALRLLILFFCLGLALYYGQLAVRGARFASYPTNRHVYADGRLVRAGAITDRNGVVLAHTQDGQRLFNENAEIRQATVHAVGDLEGYVSTGVHTAFWAELTGYDAVNGLYSGNGAGHNMQLTLDADLCVTAWRALGRRAGTVGVFNYNTGEILCMVSTPTFDPQLASADAGSQKGVYVNRLLSGSYAPGSVFKVVTALSVLQNLPDAQTRTFTCQRGVTIEDEWLSCLGNHGTVDLQTALVKSCNAAFAQFALAVGRENLTRTAQSVGFDRTLTMDGIACTQSHYEGIGARSIDFGWSGIGQYNDTVNPFQYMTFMGAIAGGGSCARPHLVAGTDSLPGKARLLANRGRVNMMRRDHAQVLGDMMRKAVTDHYGDWQFNGLELCAKTGTAEIGDRDTPHSWFVGFCRAESKPYAFVVVVENAGSGLGAASSIAARVLQAAPSAE